MRCPHSVGGVLECSFQKLLLFLLRPFGDSKSRFLGFLSFLLSGFLGFCWEGMFFRAGAEGPVIATFLDELETLAPICSWARSPAVLSALERPCGPPAAVRGGADGHTQACLPWSLAHHRHPTCAPFSPSCHFKGCLL